jgi:hypothetical protein
MQDVVDSNESKKRKISELMEAIFQIGLTEADMLAQYQKRRHDGWMN